MAATPAFCIAPLLGLAAVPVVEMVVTASQTFLAGAVLIDGGSAGTVSEGGANPTGIVGIAVEGVTSSAAGDVIRVIPALPGIVFEGRLLGNAAADYTLTQTDVFVEFAIVEDASGYWYLDQSVTGANGRARVIGLGESAVGDVNARVQFVFSYDITLYAAS
jgi:hypothetical protein